MKKCTNISTYIRRPLVIFDFASDPSELPYIWEWGKFYFILYHRVHCAGSITEYFFRSLIAEVWSVLQENAVKYVSNTMFLPLIVRWAIHVSWSEQTMFLPLIVRWAIQCFFPSSWGDQTMFHPLIVRWAIHVSSSHCEVSNTMFLPLICEARKSRLFPSLWGEPTMFLPLIVRSAIQCFFP